MKLTVEEYEKYERKGFQEIESNRILEAFSPIVFNYLGYPVRVQKENELVRYVDVMHETQAEDNLQKLLQGLSLEEFDLLKKIATQTMRLCEQEFHRKRACRATLLRDINVFRHIQALAGKKKLRLFEIGCGSGYLGALAQLSGWSYLGTDITQAFYLWQNMLWSYISKNALMELLSLKEWETFRQSTTFTAHIPWWIMGQISPATFPSFDVVTCNHALNEMHPYAARFFARCIATALSQNQGIFVFEGWGADNKNPTPTTFAALRQAGLRLLYQDTKITLLVPPNHSEAPFVFPDELNFSFNYTTHFQNPHSSLSQKIIEIRKKTLRKIDLKQLSDFYTELLGSGCHLTPDEEFWKLIGVNL